MKSKKKARCRAEPCERSPLSKSTRQRGTPIKETERRGNTPGFLPRMDTYTRTPSMTATSTPVQMDKHALLSTENWSCHPKDQQRLCQRIFLCPCTGITYFSQFSFLDNDCWWQESKWGHQSQQPDLRDVSHHCLTHESFKAIGMRSLPSSSSPIVRIALEFGRSVRVSGKAVRPCFGTVHTVPVQPTTAYTSRSESCYDCLGSTSEGALVDRCDLFRSCTKTLRISAVRVPYHTRIYVSM